jgi:predicted nucleic acid-binding protein
MGSLAIVPSDLFLDASYAIALGSPRDQHHAAAVALAGRIESEGSRLVTTRAVLLEVGNALARRQHRSAAVTLLNAIEHDSTVEVVPLSEELFREGWELFRQHRDKEWGLTDCLSFSVMRARGIAEALTADDHFRQAGFRVLLGDA